MSFDKKKVARHYAISHYEHGYIPYIFFFGKVNNKTITIHLHNIKKYEFHLQICEYL